MQVTCKRFDVLGSREVALQKSGVVGIQPCRTIPCYCILEREMMRNRLGMNAVIYKVQNTLDTVDALHRDVYRCHSGHCAMYDIAFLTN